MIDIKFHDLKSVTGSQNRIRNIDGFSLIDTSFFPKLEKMQNRKFREARLLLIGLLLRNHPGRFLPIGGENSHATF